MTQTRLARRKRGPNPNTEIGELENGLIDIRTARDRAGLSLEKVAKDAGMAPASLSNVERGRRGITLDRYDLVLRALQFSDAERAEHVVHAMRACSELIDGVLQLWSKQSSQAVTESAGDVSREGGDLDFKVFGAAVDNIHCDEPRVEDFVKSTIGVVEAAIRSQLGAWRQRVLSDYQYREMGRSFSRNIVRMLLRVGEPGGDQGVRHALRHRINEYVATDWMGMLIEEMRRDASRRQKVIECYHDFILNHDLPKAPDRKWMWFYNNLAWAHAEIVIRDRMHSVIPDSDRPAIAEKAREFYDACRFVLTREPVPPAVMDTEAAVSFAKCVLAYRSGDKQAGEQEWEVTRFAFHDARKASDKLLSVRYSEFLTEQQKERFELLGEICKLQGIAPPSGWR